MQWCTEVLIAYGTPCFFERIGDILSSAASFRYVHHDYAIVCDTKPTTSGYIRTAAVS